MSAHLEERRRQLQGFAKGDQVSTVVAFTAANFQVWQARADREAKNVRRLVRHWLEELRSAERGEEPLCLTCDTVFYKDTPLGSFVLLMPFAAAAGDALVAAICSGCAPRCANENELITMAMGVWRSSFNLELRECQEGHG